MRQPGLFNREGAPATLRPLFQVPQQSSFPSPGQGAAFPGVPSYGTRH